ncbi:unnamed protein product [Effrenium voratum]|nr:unnamed protein product [Effrenium voratum]
MRWLHLKHTEPDTRLGFGPEELCGFCRVQVLHEADPCCFHGCGRHERIEDFNRYVRGRAAGLFRTVVTEGNMHEVNPRDKIVAGILIEKISRGKAISPADLQTPFNLLAELERPTEQSAFVI